MIVEKRDGTNQPYDFSKVKNAVDKAFWSVKQEPSAKFFEHLENKLSSLKEERITVEEIQDIIQKELIKSNKYDVVESFILYRKTRAESRERNSELVKGISKKLRGGDIQNQNANVDEASFGGRKGEAISLVCKNDALTYVVCKKSRKNHENNEIYIHDLDSVSDGEHNCLTEPIDNLLEKGFKTRQCDVRPAGSINTAMQLVAVSFQLQSLQQFGGVSSSHLDHSMIPYVRKSFKKHYLAEYIKTLPEFRKLDILNISHEELDEWVKDKVIDFFMEHRDLDNDYVWTFANKDIFDAELYQKAIFETKKETYQAVEGMYHNLNTLQSRSGCQLPFSSINYGTSTELEGRMVIKALLEVSLKGLGPNYTTPIFPCGIFQYMKGVNDKPGTPNYDLKRLALKSTANRIYPNYANVDWTVNIQAINRDREIKANVISMLTPSEQELLMKRVNESLAVKDFLKKFYIEVADNKLVVNNTPHPTEITSTMGCRTYNGGDINADENYFYEIIKELANEGRILDYGLYSHAQKDGRGNICPVTIIMPTLAMEVLCKTLKNVVGDNNYESMLNFAHNSGDKVRDEIVKAFLKYLDKKISEAKDMLIERFNHIANQPASAAKFMYTNCTMAGYVPEKGIISALMHGTLAIGQLGLANTLEILIGKNHTTEEGMALAEAIEQLFNKRCKEFKETYKMNFGVYYTPAENLCHTALKKFRSKYGVLKNISDREYFTNSMHIPVWEKVGSFQKIDLESRLTGYSNAGCITYVELPDGTKNNINAMEELVDYAMERDIPYFAVNIPLDTCQNCGHTGEFGVCPVCGSTNITHLRRITGYLSSDVSHFNTGKREEEGHRVKHTDQQITELDI